MNPYPCDHCRQQLGGSIPMLGSKCTCIPPNYAHPKDCGCPKCVPQGSCTTHHPACPCREADHAKQLAEMEAAIRVLAEDKVHGIADMVGRAVLANPIAAAAVAKAREVNP